MLNDNSLHFAETYGQTDLAKVRIPEVLGLAELYDGAVMESNVYEAFVRTVVARVRSGKLLADDLVIRTARERSRMFGAQVPIAMSAMNEECERERELQQEKEEEREVEVLTQQP